jgi:hypothetical protein
VGKRESVKERVFVSERESVCEREREDNLDMLGGVHALQL